MAFSSVLDGPVMPIHDSAVTCGGIIIGSMNRKLKIDLPRMSQSVRASAKAPPIPSEISMPENEVESVFSAASQSAGSARSRHISPFSDETTPI